MYPLENPDSIENFAAELRNLGTRCSSTEDLALGAVDYLYSQITVADHERDCALMRFFRTMPYSDLQPHLQINVKKALGYEPAAGTNCLTLLATRGIEPAWNDRFASKNHQVIPLLSKQIIEQAPMVAQLIHRLGIDTSLVVEPSPTLFLTPQQKLYSVMYVPEARDDKRVFAQAAFIEPYGVRSVIGFGTLLPTGDMFAVLMFMRVHVAQNTAQKCYLLSQALEVAINELRSGKKSGARILIAAAADGIERMNRILSAHHTVIYAPTVEKAMEQLDQGNFDLVACETTFDDSRMFDLLTEFKKQKRERTKPFVCFSQVPSLLGDGIDRGVKKAVSVLGATCYIDAAQMADADLLGALQSYLPEKIWHHSI